MKPRNPNYLDEIHRVFSKAPFIADLGIELVHAAPGVCETRLNLRKRHLQQDGFVHAGITTTLADHTAGTAAASLIAPGELILTAEFKINFLRPATGASIGCRATVIKPGTRLSVVEAEVTCDSSGRSILVAKALLSMAVIDKPSADGTAA
jgi:uncharacterized protein (TIGR00369 family)